MPQLKFLVQGPTPAGASLVWEVVQPNGTPWFEHFAVVPELSSGHAYLVELEPFDVPADIVTDGVVSFTVRLVSELDGVDELLHDGSLVVQALDGDKSFAVDNDWLLTMAFVALDVVDEFDAPKLALTMFLKGEVDDYQLEAHCFYNGTRFAKASDIETRYAFTASDGSVVGREVVALFDAVRGWNNLSDSGWGGDWHLLDSHDGQYEVKLLRDSRVARVVAFTVQGGRIVVPEAGAETEGGSDGTSAVHSVEFSPEFGAVILTDASVHGDLDGAWSSKGASAFYGARAGATAARRASIDDVYAQRVERPSEVAEPFDNKTALALQAYVDRVERLLATWESDLIGTPGPFDYGQVLAAEAVLRERPGYDELATAIHVIADAHPVERPLAVPVAGFDAGSDAAAGRSGTLGDLRNRMIALFAAAETRVSASAGGEDAELAPYRALLSGDKLAIFEDHPASGFVYTTIGGQIIRTPEELAQAEYWFFEGPTDVPSTATVEGVDVPSTATVEGVDVRVTVRGWRVRGWRFDPEGAIVDTVESSGFGQTAPSSAFRPGR
ncbi:MAG: hypothetical protein JWQ19_1977 [Subtercola sp.]|nr:hypothetical protein [Subtercola sp.]